ncbi:MAG TPA: hypothetical protein VGX94_12905 [Terriglobia bacterium]|nr:hypothetical protein [Terriglobia bacterium]
MAKTAVGLFENRSLADAVVHDLEASGFPKDNVRVMGEPKDMPVTGLMSTPRTDFEVGLTRELEDMGATQEEAEACVRGIKNKGVLVFATGPDTQVTAATKLMTRHAGADVESLGGDDPHLPSTVGEDDKLTSGDRSMQAGRVRYSGAGAHVFVW